MGVKSGEGSAPFVIGLMWSLVSCAPSTERCGESDEGEAVCAAVVMGFWFSS